MRMNEKDLRSIVRETIAEVTTAPTQKRVTSSILTGEGGYQFRIFSNGFLQIVKTPRNPKVTAQNPLTVGRTNKYYKTIIDSLKRLHPNDAVISTLGSPTPAAAASATSVKSAKQGTAGVVAKTKPGVQYLKHVQDQHAGFNEITLARLRSGGSVPVTKCSDKGCSAYVGRILGQKQGNAWHAHNTAGSLKFSAFSGIGPDGLNQMAKIFSKINANPKEKSAEADVRGFVSKLVPNQMGLAKVLQLGDVVGLFHFDSSNHTKAFFEGGTGYREMGGANRVTSTFFMDKNGKAWEPSMLGQNVQFLPGRKTLQAGARFGMNTHVGYVGAFVDGIPVIFHFIDSDPDDFAPGTVYATPLNAMGVGKGKDAIVWIKSVAA